MSIGRHLGTLLVLTVSGAIALGCSGASSAEDASSETGDQALSTAANAEYTTFLQELEQKARQCDAKGCPTTLTTQSLHPLGTSDAVADTKNRAMCFWLKPLAGVEAHPYFFVGVDGRAGASIGVMAGIGGGLEATWDLKNRQAAIFGFADGRIEGSFYWGATLRASAYTGLAFGKRDDVLSAWTGVFGGLGKTTLPTDLMVQIPQLLKFAFPYTTVQAFSKVETGQPLLVGASGGVSFDPTLQIGQPGGYTDATVGPMAQLWDSMVKMMGGGGLVTNGPLAEVKGALPLDWATENILGKGMIGVDQKIVTTPKGSYVQYASDMDLALASLQRVGPLAVIPAGMIAALHAQQKVNAKIEKLCP